MTNSNNDQFLAIEKTANDLVNQLQQLATVVKNYNEVHSDLKQASQGLFTMTTQYRDVASQVGHVAITMRQVGMPDLLDAVERARQETSSSLVQLLSAIEQAHQSVSTGHQETSSSLVQLLSAIEQAHQSVSTDHQETSSSLVQLLSAIERAHQSVSTSHQETSSSLVQLLSAIEQAHQSVSTSHQETSSSLVQLLSAIEQAHQSVSTSHNGLLASIKEAAEQVLTQQSLTYHAVLSLTEKQQHDARQTKRLIIIGALLATAAGITATVFPLLNLSL